MNKKYILFVFVFFISLSSISIKASTKSDEFLESNKFDVECLKVLFNKQDFYVTFNSETGEILSVSLPDKSENINDEELVYIVIDCAEKIFGKDSDRYELNKQKFMNFIEEVKNQNN